MLDVSFPPAFLIPMMASLFVFLKPFYGKGFRSLNIRVFDDAHKLTSRVVKGVKLAHWINATVNH